MIKFFILGLKAFYDIVKKSTPSGKDLSSVYESMFQHLEGHKVDLVPTSVYTQFMKVSYGVEVNDYSEKINYYDAYTKDVRWRVVTQYIEEKGAVLVVSEDVSEVDSLRVQFESDIKGRIEEHMQREPMNVSIIVVSDDRSLVYCSEHLGDHDEIELFDMRTGKDVFDLVNETENGQFEYQIKSSDGFKNYFAFTRTSEAYDAHLILSMEKKDLSTKFGDRAGVFLKMIFILLLGFSIWTIYRFRKVLGNDFGMRYKSTNNKNSIF